MLKKSVTIFAIGMMLATSVGLGLTTGVNASTLSGNANVGVTNQTTANALGTTLQSSTDLSAGLGL